MIYTFSAGPGIMYPEVLSQIQENVVIYNDIGYSLLEASHRSAVYDAIHQETMQRFLELLSLKQKEYEVLLLGGGASLQFSMLPLNFSHGRMRGLYVISGSWSKKAFAEAKKVSDARVLYDGAENMYRLLPKNIRTPSSSNLAYTHFTTNETIHGIQWRRPPKVPGTLVTDMSSDILSRSIPKHRYALFYAGAQKNIGPAGLTVVIAKKEFLEGARNDLPSYLSYKTHWTHRSLYNTPPVFAIWSALLTLRHLESLGGLRAIQKHNIKKASLLYDCIDTSGGFYTNFVNPSDRSHMNVVFRLPTEKLETTFIKEAETEGCIGLKGHRSVGGCRASLYNAMPLKGVQTLVEFMTYFHKKNG